MRPGDQFLDANGNLCTLTSANRVEYEDNVTVYNITVADNSNYFVIAEGELGQTCILVHNARLCGADLVKFGQDGEKAAGVPKNTQPFVGESGKTRIPDGWDDDAKRITEVKNVKYQHLSTQILDSLKFAQSKGYEFVLMTRHDTRLSWALQQKIINGEIIHLRF